MLRYWSFISLVNVLRIENKQVMKTIKKFTNVIVLTLVIVFMVPVTVKLLDTFFHKHNYFHCSTTNDTHFHKYHKECPISSYKLSFFSIKKYIPTIQKYVYLKERNENYNFTCNCDYSKYSFLLRAPPIIYK